MAFHCGCGRWPWRCLPVLKRFWQECCGSRVTGTRTCWRAGQCRLWMKRQKSTSMSGIPWLHIPPKTTWSSGKHVPSFFPICLNPLLVFIFFKDLIVKPNTSLFASEHGKQTCQREHVHWCAHPWTMTALLWLASAPTSSCHATTLSPAEAASPDSHIFPGSTAGGWILISFVVKWYLVAAARENWHHVTCVLFRGRFPEWYNKLYGHLCAAEVARIRDSFTVPMDKWERSVQFGPYSSLDLDQYCDPTEDSKGLFPSITTKRWMLPSLFVFIFNGQILDWRIFTTQIFDAAV